MKRLLALVGVLIIASLVFRFTAQRETSSQFRVWMLDVGQGESVLIMTPEGQTILFDGGPNDTVLHELGQILPPWDRTIDVIVLSHPHSDHIRGLIEVVRRMSVGMIWSSGASHGTADYRAWERELEIAQLLHRHVYQGATQEWTNLTLRVVHPPQSMSGQQPSNAHDATVALRATFYENYHLLLTGDLNDTHEDDLIDTCLPPDCVLKSDILQVPHHGSASGLEPAFLAAIDPSVALIPVGAQNRFNHPRSEILERLERAGIPVFRTDTDGRITLEITPENVNLTTLTSNRTWQAGLSIGGSEPQSRQWQPRQLHHQAWVTPKDGARASPFSVFAVCPPCRTRLRPFSLLAA